MATIKSIEEKARRYDKALERANKLKETCDSNAVVGWMEYIFPELKESGDIRKRIIDALHGDVLEMGEIKKAIAWLEKQGNLMKALQISNAEIGELIEKNYYLKEQLEKQGNNMGISEVTKQELEDNLNKALEKETTESWNKFLDEQGEQKPTDKFHEGDWVVISTSDGEKVVQIDSIEYFKNGKPRYITSEGRWFSNGTEARLWNIAKDAKDGDVLVASDSSIFIFKGTINCACKHYIALATDGAIEINEGLKHYWETSRAVHPATKEQRDTLMKAMADAGYTFDFEKKELSKIEQEQVIDYLDNLPKDNWELVHEFVEKFGRIPKDEDELNVLVEYVLKRQKPSWNEEDEKMYFNIKASLQNASKDYRREIGWFHLLRLRKQWRPSDKQMNALNDILSIRDIKYDVLSELWKDLDKLRGE